jgi:alkylated DNA repair dioxygenase AlkB
MTRVFLTICCGLQVRRGGQHEREWKVRSDPSRQACKECRSRQVSFVSPPPKKRLKVSAKKTAPRIHIAPRQLLPQEISCVQPPLLVIPQPKECLEADKTEPRIHIAPRQLLPQSHDVQHPLLARIRKYGNGKWGPWADVFRSDIESVVVYDFPQGGTVKVYPGMLSQIERKELVDELLSCQLWKQYRIQCVNEPRAHFLLHSKATNDADKPQPGYQYAGITLKARPLSLVPNMHSLALYTQELCKVPCWNIGAHPVYYRDGNDHMGLHADDDQGESTILSVLVDSPPEPRKVIISPNKKKKPWIEGDQQLQLFMHAGDAYEMDGKLQENYLHGVPKDGQTGDPDHQRIAVVFRHGSEKYFTKDNGVDADLTPRTPAQYNFGSQIVGLDKGKLYTKMQIVEMGAHR